MNIQVDQQTDFRDIRTYVFLVGSGTSENGISMETMYHVLTTFIKCAQEDECNDSESDRTIVTIAQYAKEGIRKVFHSEDVTDAGSAVININIQATPAAPFKALEEVLLWIEERKKDYKKRGLSYYPFRIICFPNTYTQSTDDCRFFNTLLLRCMEMRESIRISALRIDKSQDELKLFVVGKDKQTWLWAGNLYQNTKISLWEMDERSDPYYDYCRLADAYHILDSLQGLLRVNEENVNIPTDWLSEFTLD